MKGKSKKKYLVVASILALLTMLLGTFAWQTFQDQKLNRVKSATVVNDSVQVLEKWSKTPITPGGTATKEVQVSNSSDVQVFVRATFEEVMKHFADQGKETTAAEPAEYDPATAELTDDIPVFYAGDPAALSSQGWSNITANVNGLPSLPSDATGEIQVWAKGSSTANPLTPSQIEYIFEYKIFYHYVINGVDYYQKMSADIAQPGNAPAGTPVTAWTGITAANVKYYIYKGGYNYITKNWGKSNMISPYAPPGTTTPNDFALLSNRGINNGEDFDYTLSNLGAGHTLPTVISVYSTGPTVSGDKLNVFADNDAAFGSIPGTIQVEYGAVTTTSAFAPDSWVYNKEDGWFYYTAKLDIGYSGTAAPGIGSGAAGATNFLMTKLHYGSTDDRYNNVTYDLVVKTEAVQANDMAAVEEVFKLSDTNAGSETAKIYTFMKGL